LGRGQKTGRDPLSASSTLVGCASTTLASIRPLRPNHLPTPQGNTANALASLMSKTVSSRLRPSVNIRSVNKADTSIRSLVSICRPAIKKILSWALFFRTTVYGSAVGKMRQWPNLPLGCDQFPLRIDEKQLWPALSVSSMTESNTALPSSLACLQKFSWAESNNLGKS